MNKFSYSFSLFKFLLNLWSILSYYNAIQILLRKTSKLSGKSLSVLLLLVWPKQMYLLNSHESEVKGIENDRKGSFKGETSETGRPEYRENDVSESKLF